jgi:hypothetical protein
MSPINSPLTAQQKLWGLKNGILKQWGITEGTMRKFSHNIQTGEYCEYVDINNNGKLDKYEPTLVYESLDDNSYLTMSYRQEDGTFHHADLTIDNNNLLTARTSASHHDSERQCIEEGHCNLTQNKEDSYRISDNIHSDFLEFRGKELFNFDT